MQPYYEDESVTLYHGDCREIDAWLAADVLVTDPPYGRAWRQGEIKGRRASSPRTGIANDMTTAARDEMLFLWAETLMGGQLRPTIMFGDLMLPPPSDTKLVAAYQKPPDAGSRGAIAGIRRDLEAIYLLGRWDSGLGGRSSVFRTNAATVGNPVGLAARYGHPHAKPLDVMSELIGMTRGVVADPFAGSGSTLVAAKQLGRKAIGVELEERYCEATASRLAQGVLDFREGPEAKFPTGKGALPGSVILPYGDGPSLPSRSLAERMAGSVEMKRQLADSVQKAAEDAAARGGVRKNRRRPA